MPHELKPLSCNSGAIAGMSEKIIVSHYENNYGGAVKRLNAIEGQLAELDWATAPIFVINGLKREQMVAMNSMLLHEVFFDSLGVSQVGQGLAGQIDRDFGSLDRWAVQFSAMGRALGGVPAGSCWLGRHAMASWSTPGPPIIRAMSRARHRCWRSTCTSTATTWTSAPRPAPISMPI